MIRVEDLHVRAGSFTLSGVSFEVPTGQYGVLMGRTGTGKTTILEAICGLKHVERGSIVLGDREVSALKPAERNIGFVPQDGALFATMTVRDQLAFSMRVRGWARDRINQRVAELADMLGIEALLHRRPQGLSGGESQRVALGRALSAEPAVLCLDEPLSALDEQTRMEMYDLLQSVREHTHVTTLHITHNLGETRRLADRAFVLRDGQVQQVTGEELAALAHTADAPQPG